jgi:DNA transformation protein
MFGGIGLFHQGLMFGKIGGDTFRLKVDEHNKKEYEDREMKPFYSEKKKKGMPYWEVPIEVFEDRRNWLSGL